MSDEVHAEPTAKTGDRSDFLAKLHGVVDLDPVRVNKQVADVVEHVIQHLSGLSHANVEVTLEVQADVPDGVSDGILRTVTENARTLKFRDHGFAKE